MEQNNQGNQARVFELNANLNAEKFAPNIVNAAIKTQRSSEAW